MILVIRYTIGWIAPRSELDALMVGVMWLGLTLAFEFGASHYLVHKPWSALLADYNIAAGRIWVLALLTTLLAPWVLARRMLHP